MVKVGNSECEFLKLTPLSRTSAIAGAVCGVTMRPRKPSGTNRIRLRGVAFCADAVQAVSVIRPADNNTILPRIRILPIRSNSATRAVAPGLVLLCDRIVTLARTGLKGGPGRLIPGMEEFQVARRDRKFRKPVEILGHPVSP